MGEPGWAHPCCLGCWEMEHGPVRRIALLLKEQPDTCCWCGGPTRAGIYMRAPFAALRCEGKHSQTYDVASDSTDKESA